MANYRKYAPFFIILFFVVLLILFVVFNKFDSPPPNKFAPQGILRARENKQNGFYIIWALSEPKGIDVLSDQIIAKYKEQKFNYKKYKQDFRHISRPISATHVTRPRVRNLFAVVQRHRENIKSSTQRLDYLLKRYQYLLDAPYVEDNTKIEKDIRKPNIKAFLNVSKFFTGMLVDEALDGLWDKFMKRCLQQIDLCKRVIKTARTLEANRAGKSLLRYVLRSIVSAVNHPECPTEVSTQLLARLKPLDYDSFGSHNALLCEYFFFTTWLNSYKGHFRNQEGTPPFMILLFQENRTMGYYAKLLKRVQEQEGKPPYLWLESIPLKPPLKGSKLWWMQNMSGKLLYDILILPDFNAHIVDSYYTLALYRLTRIVLEYRKKGIGKNLSSQAISDLESFKLKDPFSGKSFKWVENKGEFNLYSVGENRKDDHAISNPQYPILDIVVTLKKLKGRGGERRASNH